MASLFIVNSKSSAWIIFYFMESAIEEWSIQLIPWYLDLFELFHCFEVCNLTKCDSSHRNQTSCQQLTSFTTHCGTQHTQEAVLCQAVSWPRPELRTDNRLGSQACLLKRELCSGTVYSHKCSQNWRWRHFIEICFFGRFIWNISHAAFSFKLTHFTKHMFQHNFMITRFQYDV